MAPPHAPSGYWRTGFRRRVRDDSAMAPVTIVFAHISEPMGMLARRGEMYKLFCATTFIPGSAVHCSSCRIWIVQQRGIVLRAWFVQPLVPARRAGVRLQQSTTRTRSLFDPTSNVLVSHAFLYCVRSRPVLSSSFIVVPCWFPCRAPLRTVLILVVMRPPRTRSRTCSRPVLCSFSYMLVSVPHASSYRAHPRSSNVLVLVPCPYHVPVLVPLPVLVLVPLRDVRTTNPRLGFTVSLIGLLSLDLIPFPWWLSFWFSLLLPAMRGSYLRFYSGLWSY
ncbi:hypothetical protein B0H16DRAFT_1748237 [Mycena metata]|uniref:Uncharacterized protein n=1 Tax=Mycena metata TaxID=1033252 RepID=A0AAD7E0W9_9AGAR|nr:hypothetical protein B0H16DRAFT_1748237 [Mycena metata]